MSNELYDFSSLPLHVSRYDGASGKQTIYIDGERFMLKFGYPIDSNNKRTSETSYANIPVNEFIGSHLFAATGIPTQQTWLGTYRGQSVIACRDFMQDYPEDYLLIHFKQLEISMPGESSLSKARPDWEFVHHVISDSPFLSRLREQTFHRYYQMLCVDALIGNFDRHSNNWGFIADENTNIQQLAPVYDCGSCLAPHVSEEVMRERLQDPQLMSQVNRDSPYMAMNVRNKRRKFSFFLLSDEARPFRQVLPSLYETLTPDALTTIVDSTPGISNLQKDFYRATLLSRRQVVLQPAYELAMKEQQLTSPRPHRLHR